MTTSTAILNDLDTLGKLTERYKGDKVLGEAAVFLMLLLTKKYQIQFEVEMTGNFSGVFTDEELAYLRKENKISCIKLVRERLNMSLAEAKKYVEEKGEELGIFAKVWNIAGYYDYKFKI